MKTLHFLILLLFFSGALLQAQGQYRIEWATQFPNIQSTPTLGEFSVPIDVAVDSAGKSYILVTFTSEISIDGTLYTNSAESELNPKDTLLVKLDADGTPLATRHFDSASYGGEFASKVFVTQTGEVFASILYEPSANENLGPNPCTLFRLDSSLNDVWTMELPDQPASLASTEDGRVLVAFTLNSARSFADGTNRMHRYQFGSWEFDIKPSRTGVVIVKLDASGGIVGAERVGIPQTGITFSPQLIYAGNGRFFFSCRFSGSISVGDQLVHVAPAGVTPLGYSVFFALYDWNTGFQWGKRIDGYNTNLSGQVKMISRRPGIAQFVGLFSRTVQFGEQVYSVGELNGVAVSQWDIDGNLVQAGQIEGLRNPDILEGGLLSLQNVVAIPGGDILVDTYFEQDITLPDGKILHGGYWLLTVNDVGTIERYQSASWKGHPATMDPGGNLIATTVIDDPLDIFGVRVRSRSTAGGRALTVIKLGPGNIGSPYIVEHPQAPVTLSEEPVTMTVDARGSGQLSYQWQKDGIDLDGETAMTLSIPSVTMRDEGEYSVIITNPLGFIESASVSVFLPPERTEVTIDWALQYGYSDAERIVAVDSDAQGNVYFAGRMENIMLMGDETVAGFMFVAKADRDGNLLWRFGDGTASPFPADKLYVYDMVVGDDGGIYVCGGVTGNGQIGSYSFSAQWRDAYLARLNPDGTFDWAQVIGGTLIDEARTLAAVPGGGVVVAGQFASTSPLLPTKAGGEFDPDAFVAKIDSNGTVDWAMAYGGPGSETVHDITAGSETATFSVQYTAPFTLGGTALLDPTGKGLHMFLAEIDLTNGNVLRATSMKGSIGDVAANEGALGGTVVAGSVVETLVFNGQTLTNVSDGTNSLDGFIGLYASTGNNWLNQISARGSAGFVALGGAGNGRLYGIGSFSGTEVSFDAERTLSSPNTELKRFVARYDEHGSLRWVTALETPSFYPSSIVAGSGDSAYVGGSFNGTVTLDQRVYQNFETIDGPPKNKTDAMLFKLTGTEAPPIYFIQHPKNLSVAVGGDATLTAEVSDTVINWQWFTGSRSDDSTPISGATMGTLSPPDTTGTHHYWVRAELGDGSFLRSATATVEFVQPPTFIEQPERAFVDRDAAATLMAQASGRGLTYQWFQGESGDLSDPQSFGARTRFVTPPITETTFYWARATDYLGQSVASLAAQVSPVGEPAGGYNIWKNSATNGFTEEEKNSATFDSDDPDDDGLGNLAEYALGLKPKTRNGNPLQLQNKNGLSLSFPALRSDVPYSVEHSTDGQNWIPIDVQPEHMGNRINIQLPAELADGLVRLALYRP